MNVYTAGIPTLTSEPEDAQDILHSINNLDAWCWILGFRVSLGENFRNPFRADNNPGCWLYESRRGDGIIYLSDFASPEHNGITFIQALRYIYPTKSFYHQLKSFRVDYILKNNLTVHQSYKKPLNESEFSFYLKSHARRWLYRDREFWTPYEITRKNLENEDVNPVAFYEKNSKYNPHLVQKHIPLDIAYSIHINKREKIYRPLAPREVKWISNLKKEDIGGKSQCSGNVLWLTKSYKDYQVLTNQGLDSRFTLNEGIPLPPAFIDKTIRNFHTVISLMDNDPTGRVAAKYYENQIRESGGNAYGATLPIEYYEQGITDPADLIKSKGQKQLNYELTNIYDQALSGRA